MRQGICAHLCDVSLHKVNIRVQCQMAQAGLSTLRIANQGYDPTGRSTAALIQSCQGPDHPGGEEAARACNQDRLAGKTLPSQRGVEDYV